MDKYRAGSISVSYVYSGGKKMLYNSRGIITACISVGLVTGHKTLICFSNKADPGNNITKKPIPHGW